MKICLETFAHSAGFSYQEPLNYVYLNVDVTYVWGLCACVGVNTAISILKFVPFKIFRSYLMYLSVATY